MGYEKIYCVNHVGQNLLIVGYDSEKQWQFRAVTKEGKVVKEVSQLSTAEEAENKEIIGSKVIYPFNLIENEIIG